MPIRKSVREGFGRRAIYGRMGAFGSAVALSLIAAVGGVSAGCGRSETPPQTAAERVRLPTRDLEVARGRVFMVSMVDELSSFTAIPGRTFEARILEPLVAETGELLVPYGAILRGHVVSVGGEDEPPSLTVAFDTIDTVHGEASIDVEITGAPNAPFAVTPPDGKAEADARLVRDERALEEPGVGGGPPALRPEVVVPKEIGFVLTLERPLRVPRGAGD
jgi:hypothetical protein